MARTLFLLLVLANVGYFAWSQGWLAGIGMAPARQTEPQRLSRQIQPEALNVVPESKERAPATAARATTPSHPTPASR